MSTLNRRHLFALAGLSVVTGFLACREPTQITVEITTNAKCPSEELSAPRLMDVKIASGITVKPNDFVEISTTEQCTPDSGSAASIGSLVLLPSGGQPGVEVLVVAGVEVPGPNAEVSPLKLGSDECQKLIADGGVGAIGGKPCILSRRRLGFVDHTKLVLPIDLDTRCIGKKCGEDESCSKGNCVPIDVDCDENGCKEPPGCADDCDAGCPSGTGRCQDGVCGCLLCDAGVCADTCAISQQVGVCTAQDVCLCQTTCDPATCEAGDCGGQCDGADCNLATCDENTCGGPGCTCEGDPEVCVCAGACDASTCALQECACGQVAACGEVAGSPACICGCDQAACDEICELGGVCQPSGECACSSCVDGDCTGMLCDAGQVGQCYDDGAAIGCACICDEDLCSAECAGLPNLTGSHCASGAPGGACVCETGNPNGGGGQGGTGGNGGAGGSTSSSGGGGFGGFGGGSSSSSGGFGGGGPCSCAGVSCGSGQFCDMNDNCTCECQANACQSFCQITMGTPGTCIGINPGNCMCDPVSSGGGGIGPVAGFTVSMCLAGSTTPLPGCNTFNCTSYCNTVDCTIGTCIGANTCECN
jgi:hypothetical protein